MLHIVFRVAGVTFLVYIAVIAKLGSSLFSFHPVLMTFSFTGAMSEALFIFTKYGVASRSTHRTRVTAHWIMIGLAALCHSVGYAVIYYNKEVNNKPHHTSWHGFLGFIVSILFWIQVSFGFFAKYPLLLRSFLSVIKIRTSHALFGILIFISGIGTMILGLWSSWFVSNASVTGFYGALGLYVVLVFAAIFVLVEKYSKILCRGVQAYFQ
ncbi:transmembrane reductase CYB561D2-like [Palaemon carinicauda]|uniref:transmembrane reductase CYB561D2-like n=1 Tax=Palaemon carinicauda TaxID=392227 RepID=UPI0035B647E0